MHAYLLQKVAFGAGLLALGAGLAWGFNLLALGGALVLGWSMSAMYAMHRKRNRSDLKDPKPAVIENSSIKAKSDSFYSSQALEVARAGTWRIHCLEDPTHVYLSQRMLELTGRVPIPPDNRYPTQVWRDGVLAAGDPVSAERALNALDKALANELVRYDVAYAFKRPLDGEIVWLRDVAELMYDQEGRMTELVGITLDVTQAKRSESEILHAKLLAESATRMKSDFLANMSHEIRTPMNAIIGLSHLALKTPLTPSQRDYLKKIQNSGKHLLGIINDVLDFSKIEAGKLTVEESDFELSKVLANVVNLAGEKSVNKDIELIVNVNASVPDSLNGDPLRLGQILINYVSNAIKFTEKGEVSIAVYPLEQTAQEVLLRFDVRDCGIGMNQEQAQNLFQRFQQGDASTTRKYGGSGLGLAISKSLAELMHGEVGVESEPGKGSNFWFTVRLKIGTQRARDLIPQPDLRGRRVLVVDDNEHARLVMLDLLNDMTFMVDAVDGSTAAFLALQQEDARQDPYEIVFLDWQMPDMDGIELARHIKLMPLKHMPRMIMVTAFGRQEILKTAMEAGIDDVLIKPVNPSVLFDAAVRSVRGEATTPEVDESAQYRSGLDAIAGARVLLVEDNFINQQVALEMLADAGLVVEVAEDGQIALQKIASAESAWDLVLMDIQMPVMDGVEATLEIRKTMPPEKLCIVAMTASAMRQDRELCIAAGMQDFLSKPIEPEDLWRMLLRWIKPRDRMATTEAVAPPVTAVEAGADIPENIDGLDTRLGLQRVLGKKASYARLLRNWVQTEKWAFKRIATALEADDLKRVQLLAHSTKGSAGNVGATQVETLAETVEDAVRKKLSPDQIQRAVAALEAPLASLMQSLQAWLADHQVPDGSGPGTSGSMDVLNHELLRLLDEDDSSATDLFQKNMLLYQAHYPSHFHEMDTAIKNYDFKEGQRKLKEAISATILG